MSNPNRQSKPEIERSEQTIQNWSFDNDYKVLAVEMLAENQAGDALVRLKASNTGGLISGDSNTISRYDYSNSSEIYVGTAPKGTASATADWEITKYNLTDGSDASGLKASDVTWTGRTGHTYS